MRVGRTLAAIVFGMSLLGGLVGTAAAAGGPRPSCARLKGRHLKGAGSVRVIVTRVKIEGESAPIANVCASAHARAWPFGASINEGLQGTEISLVASSGQWVALRFTGFLGIASLEVGKAMNARTGQRFTYSRFGIGPGTEETEEVPQNVQINRMGQLAYAVNVGPEGKPAVTRKIVGVETGGRRTTLDSAPAAQIPPASLKLSGSMVQWLDAGVARSASL